jgi:prepilin-type N-terminal cleavage/methylation domain-containing protein
MWNPGREGQMLARIRKAQEESEGGFTLIELLVVIIIIGILAAIAIPVFLNQRKKAVDASIKSDLRTAATAMETYFTDNQAYNAATTQNPKFSQNNTITVGINAAGTGYCVRGQNPNSNATTTLGTYFWYDSMNGGLASGAPTATPAAGGACSTGLTFTAVT